MTNKKYLSGHYAAKSDIGKVRLSNDDRVAACVNLKGNVLLIVCDGMGGAKKGDLASTLAMNYLVEEFQSLKRNFLTKTFAMYWLSRKIRNANRIVHDEAMSHEDYKNMGTTMTAVIITSAYAVIAQVGDSRAYTLKDRHLVQLTEDQTYVAYLYRTGQISEDEMLTHPKRHVLMNALGVYPSIEIDIKVIAYNGEPFLLCSDGLYNNVPKVDIESIMKSTDTVNQKVDQLIAFANANGGSDNIGVVLWEAEQ